MFEEFMSQALKEAEKAYFISEVPVGAVIVKDGVVLSKAHNLRETMKDSTAHAEIIAIHEACRRLCSWRLTGCDIFVTLEPCPMCAGAIVNARINRVIFGTKDPKAGACGSIYNIANDLRLNHRAEVISGVMEEECKKLLKDFFKNRRA